MTEPILEPQLPIVDAHHHLRYIPPATFEGAQPNETIFGVAQAPVSRAHARYLLDEMMVDLTSGHHMIATVFADSHAMYRASGPAEMAPVGEVEFANGVAAMAASRLFGDVLLCAAIVSYADLSLGDAVQEVLEAQIGAGNGRFRGIRTTALHDGDPRIMGPGFPEHMILQPSFLSGLRRLQELGLIFEVTVFEPQLPDVLELLARVPETPMVLSHTGFPLGIGRYKGLREERFAIWRDNIRAIAAHPNVVVKIGGLALPFAGFDSYGGGASSEQLAADWRPYVETCIEAFGPERAMLESNFPEDAGSCSYAVLWNAFKRITAGASAAEKTALYSGTATRLYSLDI